VTQQSTQPPADEQLSFEAAITQLETLVDDLENGELGLDASVERFRQATQLAGYCRDLIQNAEMPSPSDPASQPDVLEPGKLPGPLLARLLETYRTPPDPAVIVTTGYGRDAAAIDAGDATLIVKSDPITFATDRAARYLVAVNANDIACLGGIPRWMTVVALLPEGKTSAQAVEELFRDLMEACTAQGISIVGGHTEITLGIDRPLLIGTLIGTAGPHGVLAPGQAQAGDDLYLTRWAGIEGTALLARELTDGLTDALGTKLVTAAAKLLRSPGISVVPDATALRAVPGISAMHDPTEGGVATAIHELAESAGVGAEVFAGAIPILPETRSIADHFGIDPFGMLSSGALLVAAAPSARRAVQETASDRNIPISRIGLLTPASQGCTLLTGSGTVPLPRFDRDEVTRVL
jgi:exodeoxyribonuclease VII small subunit